ncbi:ABC transporter ATP-binding protein [Catellatospora aurea]|uniref:ABC transporter ATP-binding protein n=1 Tax=Catellatospora aurea TaxID=1337874 RepID=A0ABW2HA90_9ACTN
MSTNHSAAPVWSARDGRPYLEVTDLEVSFPTADGIVCAVQGLTYSLALGRTLAIVGESGSGKSVSSMAIMGLHNPAATRMSGSIRLGDHEIVGMPNEEMRRVRGAAASMIFQDPQSSLHPYFTVGDQITEAYLAHHRVSRKQARRRAADMLGRVGIPHAARRLDDYPHHFSGGMRQRVMIAMALVNDPQLLIADEPTTALDVTVQAQILDLIAELQQEFGSAVLFITHDLGVVAEIADEVLVMYGGRAVEHGSKSDILANPVHPYTWGLLRSVPALSGAPGKLRPIPGSPPSLLAPPPGCAFEPRCEFRDRLVYAECGTVQPELVGRHGQSHHRSRCHLRQPESVFQAEVLPFLP